MRYQFHEVFRKEEDGRLRTLFNMKIGGEYISKGWSFGKTITLGEIDFFDFEGCDIEAKEKNGWLEIKGLYKKEGVE